MRHSDLFNNNNIFNIHPWETNREAASSSGGVAAAASRCGRWCSQGRVDGVAAVKALVIQGSICGGNLKDRSGAALLALTNSAACQNNHGKASERLRSVSCCSAVSVMFRMSAVKVPTLQGNQLSSRCRVSSLPVYHGTHFGKWALNDVAKAADALLIALTD